MNSPIKQICEFSDHFWYPEINRYLKEIAKSSFALVKIDPKDLYRKKLNTFFNDLTVLISKIFHSLKLYFSNHYKTSFEKSVEILCASENSSKAALQKKVPLRIIKTHFKLTENKELEKLKEEKEQIEKAEIKQAVEKLQACLQMRRIRHQFVSLKETIQANEKVLNQELEIISLLSQYQENHVTLKDLDQSKPKGWKAIFKKERNQNQVLRIQVMQTLTQLQNQLISHPLISENFKNLLGKSKGLTDVLQEISNEKQRHHKDILKYEALIKENKALIYRLEENPPTF